MRCGCHVVLHLLLALTVLAVKVSYLALVTLALQLKTVARGIHIDVLGIGGSSCLA